MSVKGIIAPQRVFSIEDLRHRAKRKLPAMIFDYLEGGALDEITLGENTRDFANCASVSESCSTCRGQDVLGHHLKTPIIVSPMGQLAIFLPMGDLAIARAAADAGRCSCTAHGRPIRSETS